MSFIYDGYPRARKSHRCIFCRGTIERGERYYRSYEMSPEDDSPRTTKHHTICHEVAVLLAGDCDDFGYYAEDPGEDIYEQACRLNGWARSGGLPLCGAEARRRVFSEVRERPA